MESLQINLDVIFKSQKKKGPENIMLQTEQLSVALLFAFES